MARIISSTHRRRHLQTPAPPHSPQANCRDTGPEEDFSVALKGRIPGFSGEVSLRRHGEDRSPTAKATAMLIVVTAACLAAIIIAMICKVAAASAVLVTVITATTFTAVLISGTMISFRQGAPACSTENRTTGTGTG